MNVIGLTGGIAMGKSTVARMFAYHGVALFDADGYVHQLLAPGGIAEQEVLRHFPNTKKGKAIDRKKLGREVFSDSKKLEKLEAILHPYVREGEKTFIAKEHRKSRNIVLMDIPLLFETGADILCDMTIAVSCPEWMQWQRAKRRPEMTQQKFNDIIARQMAQSEREQRADIIIPTSLGKNHSMCLVKQALARL